MTAMSMETAVHPQVITSRSITGKTVKSPDQQALGTVHNLILDMKSGRVAFLVISTGGILGIGEKFIPVPWESYSGMPDEDSVTVNVTRETLESAPNYDRDSWEGIHDLGWLARVYQYYGFRPYWEPATI
ncbi:PRC-barrel domain containing protein [Methanoculleus sp. FWC-SCC1]|uniref:PRC-barrel domain containing protein n=1 Tax=Methanoculleus frigidifontis TaxID=2584085 RepID=A0ABT8M672_9EURY|nr:PRC-barrel domain-containing protein [Methanoculleus sp. FWC-SCC1]MDN7023406.1 PRC-barrel domain containing protein [Methanoculleus sp. FWC-SCC1]